MRGPREILIKDIKGSGYYFELTANEAANLFKTRQDRKHGEAIIRPSSEADKLSITRYSEETNKIEHYKLHELFINFNEIFTMNELIKHTPNFNFLSISIHEKNEKCVVNQIQFFKSSNQEIEIEHLTFDRVTPIWMRLD